MLYMAPMAGITDTVFRRLAKSGGADVVFTEMVSANAVCQKNKKTLSMLNYSPDEHPIGAQIFGSTTEHIATAAKIVSDLGFDFLNLNFGCPARKIIKSNSGSAVLKDLTLYARLITAAVKASSVPVSVKIRPGYDASDEKTAVLCRIAEESGSSMIIVHGRFVSQRHSGPVNPEIFAIAAASVKIAVIANGGIDSEEKAESILTKTGCSGIMLGRAAIGDFGIFRRISHYLSTGEKLPPPSWEERLDALLTHAAISSETFGEKWGLIKLRKIIPYYLKGLPNAKRIRCEINKIEDMKGLKSSLESVFVSPYL